MATDAFTNTDGTALTAHSASWLAPTGNDGMKIQGNSAVGIGADEMNANYYNITFAEAHYSKGVLHASINGAAGVSVRVQSGANSFYYAIYDSGTVFAGQCITGSLTDWDAGQGGFSAGDEIELSIDPAVTTTVYLKKNGSTVQTYTSKSALSGGRSGPAGYSTGGTAGLDSWEGGDVSAGGGYKPRSMLLGVG